MSEHLTQAKCITHPIQCTRCRRLCPERSWDFCGRCRRTRYCSVQCQRADWQPPLGNHRAKCRKASERTRQRYKHAIETAEKALVHAVVNFYIPPLEQSRWNCVLVWVSHDGTAKNVFVVDVNNLQFNGDDTDGLLAVGVVCECDDCGKDDVVLVEMTAETRNAILARAGRTQK